MMSDSTASDAARIMIRTVDLRVDYGDMTAVRDVNLAIPAGEVFGLIGPNGAGKTSVIRALATLLDPTYGEIHIGGVDVAEHPAAAHRILGYMPDLAPVYDDMRCRELLDLFAAAHFLRAAARRERVAECLELTGMTPYRDTLAGTLSRGLMQRLILAKTLLHDPQVLLLDEPASGLDPLARIELRNLLRNLRDRGRTVLISSHILSELSGFCTSVGIMNHGRLVPAGRIEDITAGIHEGRRFTIELERHDARAAEVIEAFAGAKLIEGVNGRLEVSLAGRDGEAADLLATLVRREVRVRGFYERPYDVEDLLLRLGSGAQR